MARSSRRGEHVRGRHSVQPAREHQRRRRSRAAAPVAAFAAVLMIGAGGAWALGGRDEGRPAGLASESRTPELTAAPPSSRPADRASRDGRAVPVPALGTLAAGAPTPTTTAPAPTAGPTTRRPSQAPSPSPSSQPTATRRTSSAPAPAPAPATGITAEVTRLTNVERAKAGCGALRIDSRLTTAAQAHSTDMVDRDYFSHTSPDGEGPGDRAAAAGYDRWSGENIAAGYPTAAAVVQGWMNSAGHKANILNCQSKATGVGYDARRNMWTQMFGFE